MLAHLSFLSKYRFEGLCGQSQQGEPHTGSSSPTASATVAAAVMSANPSHAISCTIFMGRCQALGPLSLLWYPCPSHTELNEFTLKHQELNVTHLLTRPHVTQDVTLKPHLHYTSDSCTDCAPWSQATNRLSQSFALSHWCFQFWVGSPFRKGFIDR